MLRRKRSAVVVAPRPPVVSTRRILPTLDVRRLCDIDQGVSDSPWYIQGFRRVFADPTHGGTVAMVEDRIVGFATYQIDGVDITVSNFAVEFGYRRIGVGRALVHSLLSEPPASFDASHFLHVSPGRLKVYCHEEQTGFQLFLRACDIRAIRVYRGYFRTDGRDCFLFAKTRG